MVLRQDFSNKLFCHWWIPAGFALFMFGLFWAPSSHHFKVAIPYLLLLPALIYAALSPSRLVPLIRLPVVWLTLLYLAYMLLLTLVLNRGDGADFGKWGLYIAMFILAIGAFMHVSDRTFVGLLLGGAVLAAAAGLYAIYRDIDSGAFWQPLYRLKVPATLDNELRAGFMFGAFALFACWCMQHETLSRWLRALSGLTALVCLMATVLTSSRAPLLGLALVGVVITASKQRWRQLALVIAVSAVILTVFWDRLSERGLSLRPEIWQYVWQQCLDQPWFGIGLTRGSLAVPTAFGLKYNTHNILLAVLYQGGLFGLLLFGAMTAATFYLSWQLRRATPVATLAALLQLYAIVVLQFDGVALFTRPDDNWVLLWLPIALHIYAQRQAAENQLPARTRSPCAAS